MITITEAANNYLSSLLEKNNKAAVRLEIKSGGCSGFVYNYSYIDEDQIDPLDYKTSLNTGTLVIDNASVLYVAGTELDYVQNIAGGSLKVQNPNSKACCGCGNSFSV